LGYKSKSWSRIIIAFEVGCREIKNNGWCSSWIVGLNEKNSRNSGCNQNWNKSWIWSWLNNKLRKVETTSKETENSRPIENCNKRQIKNWTWNS
jgi:hypothetical protein